MRIWMPVTGQAIAGLVQSGSIEVGPAFAVTPAWAAAIGETEEEVLEDIRAQSLTGQVVVVAEVQASVVDAKTGEVSVAGPISTRQISAFLAKSEPTDEDFSWFGPTEGLNLLDFVGKG